jgi:hypothetical protein
LEFPTIREVLHEFFKDQLRIPVREIQPSLLGQALVRLVNAHDRDMLVNQSPHQFGDAMVHVVRHNQGCNWRQIKFNRECWFMLLGFSLDYWNHDCIQNALAGFGRVLLWENDRSFLARLMVKARVTEFHNAPNFIVVTDSEGFQGESWTVQVEILEQQLLGNLPADEEEVPPLDLNGNSPPFNFFGLGQPGAFPSHLQHNQHNQGFNHKNGHQDDANQEMVDEMDGGLDAPPAIGQAEFLFDLNDEP